MNVRTKSALTQARAVLKGLTFRDSEITSALEAVERALADDREPDTKAQAAPRLSGEQIEAMPVWRNYVGLWPESRREIAEAVADMLAAPTPAAQADSGVQEDAARYRWLREECNRDYVEFDDRMFELDADLDDAIDAALAAKGGEVHGD